METKSIILCDACGGKGKIIYKECPSCNGTGRQVKTTTVSYEPFKEKQ
jgi:DnaJ-class molecular chaperone